MEAIIEVNGLRKRYGPITALDGMSFTVRPGQVTGFVGPNGAGKSTTMRVILGLSAPDEGSALIDGRPYRDLRLPLRHVGALLDASALQPGRSGRDHLLWLAHSQGLGGRRVDEVIERTGLRQAARRRAGGYSLGMRQRLGLAAALLGDPPVIVLDEPFNGLDPDGTDAAAVLRGLRRLWGLTIEDTALAALGLELGADVPVCLAGRPARMRGIGERLDDRMSLPVLHLVLANPRQPLATAAVFRALPAELRGPRTAALPQTLDLGFLRRSRNDLEAPARRLLPVIDDVLAELAAAPGCRLARMSGSGPTCFGVFETPAASAAAASRIIDHRPGWWVVACRTTSAP